MATLNRTVFNGGDESTGELDIGDWTVHNGALEKCEDVTGDEVIEPLSARNLLRYILMAAKGEQMTL